MYNPSLAGKDVNYARSLLLQEFDLRSDVWYLTDPISALDLPGRMLIRHADFIDPEKLRQDTFRSSHPVRVRVVLPASFEKSGKADIIRRSFVGTGKWQSCP